MNKLIKVLLVENNSSADPDHTLLFEVLRQEKIALSIDVVTDGEQAISYLNRQAPYQSAVLPDLVLLDLILPRKDGREVLAKMKSTPSLQAIPVVILIDSQAEEDIARSYNLAASSYLIKPIDLEKLTKLVNSIDEFWFTVVRYPKKDRPFTFPRTSSVGMTFQQILTAHAQWKATFLESISGNMSLDAGGISRDDLCNVGLWLHGEGKSRFGDLSSFSKLTAEHARFHLEAAKVCFAINEGKHAEALLMLDASTPYAEASQAFTQAFTAFRMDAQQPKCLGVAKLSDYR